MHRISNKYLVLFAVVALVSLVVGIVSAAPLTQNITYQGKLTNAAGSPLTGTYTLTFRLYNVSTGGTALDTIIKDVQSNQGLFTSSLPFSPGLYNGQALWIGVKVGADPEMTPRQEIRPVPYALNVAGGFIDQILTTVTDIQTKVNTLLTNLGMVQSDVTTIKSTTDTISNKLNALPKPIRYEYYTATIDRPPQTVYTELHLFNWGDTPAHVSQYHYKLSDYDPTWELIHTRSDTIPPQTGGGSYAVIGVLPTDHYRLKITTDSPYVAIDVPFTYANNVYKEYLTGDLLKVEIYS